MKAFTIVLTCILSICTGHSLAMEAEKSEAGESKIYLPTAAIITGYLKDLNAVNVILLSAVASEKTGFVDSLNKHNLSDLSSKRTLYADYISFSLSEDVKFNIY